MRAGTDLIAFVKLRPTREEGDGEQIAGELFSTRKSGIEQVGTRAECMRRRLLEEFDGNPAVPLEPIVAGSDGRGIPGLLEVLLVDQVSG